MEVATPLIRADCIASWLMQYTIDESTSHQLSRCIQKIRKWLTRYPSYQPVVGCHNLSSSHPDDIDCTPLTSAMKSVRDRNVWKAENPMSRPLTPEYIIAVLQFINLPCTITKQHDDSPVGRMESDSADLDEISSKSVVTFLARFFVMGPGLCCCDWCLIV